MSYVYIFVDLQLNSNFSGHLHSTDRFFVHILALFSKYFGRRQVYWLFLALESCFNYTHLST